MGAGEIIALASLIVTVILVVGGGMLRSRDNVIAELRREKDAQRQQFEQDREAQRQAHAAKLDLADRALDTMRETIAELRRQLDRHTITAEITDKFLSGLPRQIPPMSSPSGER